MEDKIKCNKCKNGIIGYTNQYLCGLRFAEYLENKGIANLSTLQRYDDISCIFCNGTGFVDAPEKAQDGVQDEGASYCTRCQEESYTKEEGKPTDDRLETDGEKGAETQGDTDVMVKGKNIEDKAKERVQKERESGQQERNGGHRWTAKI